MNLGNNIRKIREMRGLKQSYVAHHLNMSLKTYRNIEANKAPLTEERMQKISNVLDMTSEEIRDFDDRLLSISTLNTKRDGVAVYHNKSGQEHDSKDALVVQLKQQIDQLLDEITFLKSNDAFQKEQIKRLQEKLENNSSI